MINEINAGVPSRGSISEQLTRILQSSSFVEAPRMCRLLRWMVEKAQAGDDDVKEYTAGLEVFDRTGDFDPKTDSIVRVTTSKLRVRLRDYYATAGASDPVIIELVPGSYVPRFLLRGEKSAAVRRRHFPRAWLLAAGLAGCLVVAAFVLNARRVYPVPQSIAVLPFRNLSTAPEDAYLAEGLAAEIIGRLAQHPSLKVVAFTSTSRFRGADIDVRSAGKELGVSSVLEGTVQRVGNRLRVSARLIDAVNGYHVWARTYDREVTDLLDVQREIALSVTGSFSPRRTSAVNSRAYERYLKGRQMMLQFAGKRPEIMSLFQEAMDLDPAFAGSYSGLADVYFGMAWMDGAVPSAEVLEKVRFYATRGLELDPMSSDAHVSAGRLRELEWNWSSALREYERAIELAPASERARRRYGDLLCRSGKFEQGVKELRYALELDPFSANGGAILTLALYKAEQFEAARELGLRTLRLHPSLPFSHANLALAYLGLRDFRRAIEEHQESVRLLGKPDDPVTIAANAAIWAAAGETTSARRVLNDLLRQRETKYVPRVMLARIFAALGDRDAVMAQLVQAYEEREPLISTVKTDPRFRLVREDSRFIKLIAMLKL